ncbi:MAG: carboxypeptidase-like regulatory domain-containing protein [Reichenbachiella sp.]
MKYFLYVLLISFTCISIELDAQNSNIFIVQGSILDKDGESPLAFVNVSIGLTGTTTNLDGLFVLVVESKESKQELIINYIGYQSQSVWLKNKNIELDIALEQSSNILDPYSIYTADQIIQDFNNNRAINYTFENQLLNTYYKETTYANKEASHIAEGVFKIYQPSEFSKEETTVEVVKTRRKEIIPLDPNDLPMISGHATDMIEGVNRRKGSFLDMEEIGNYVYSKEYMTVYNGDEVYVLSFKPKNKKGTAEGVLYIDSKSKAIIRVEYHPILDNQYFWTRVKWTEEYAEKDGVWHLRRVSYCGHWETLETEFSFEALLVVTDVNDSSDKPEMENDLAANAIFFNEAPNFTDNFWETNNYVQLTEQEKISFE